MLFVPLLAAGCGSDGPEPSGGSSGPASAGPAASSGNEGPSSTSASGSTANEGTGDAGNGSTGAEFGSSGGLGPGSSGGPGPGSSSSAATGSSGAEPSGSTSGSSSDGTTGDDSGAVDFPVDCDASPVWVDGGGGYALVQDGVDGTPPGGTVYICPGTYLENVSLVHNLTIVGAGADLVTIVGAPDQATIENAMGNELTDVTVMGLSISGGRNGILLRMERDIAGQALATLVDLRVTAAIRRGISISVPHSFTFGVDTARLEMSGVTIEHVSSQYDGAGLRVSRMAAELNDCVIQDNSTPLTGAGIFLDYAVATMHGGAVHRNVAGQGGGGAFLRSNSVTGIARLDVIDADWGTGKQQENVDDDVTCQLISPFTQVSESWLGDPVSASCIADGEDDCCTPI